MKFLLTISKVNLSQITNKELHYIIKQRCYTVTVLLINNACEGGDENWWITNWTHFVIHPWCPNFELKFPIFFYLLCKLCVIYFFIQFWNVSCKSVWKSKGILTWMKRFFIVLHVISKAYYIMLNQYFWLLKYIICI